jgi:quinol monooxygenase YgiN
MRAYFWLALSIAILAATLARSAQAQSNAVYVVCYVEVMPDAVAAAATLLERYRDADRKGDGNLRSDVLQEIVRPNRFVIVEVWTDNAKVPGADRFGEKLKAIENAPPDVRINNGLYVAAEKSNSPPGAIYAVTHVDVIPPGKDETVALLKSMSVDTAKDPGNISYAVLQQANRANHFTVIEAWANRKALDAHGTAAHTRAFREKLSPFAGALYDERFYKLLG